MGALELDGEVRPLPVGSSSNRHSASRPTVGRWMVMVEDYLRTYEALLMSASTSPSGA
jgi:hypothetical protein